MEQKEPSKSPRKGWRRFAYEALGSPQPQSDVEGGHGGGDVDDKLPEVRKKRLAHKPARRQRRQKVTHDDDNAGFDFHKIMDVNDDAGVDQAIDDLCLLDNSSGDEDSSIPTRSTSPNWPKIPERNSRKKRLAHKPARRLRRQKVTHDDDNAGVVFHEIMDVNDDADVDQAIDDVCLLDDRFGDEASSTSPSPPSIPVPNRSTIPKAYNRAGHAEGDEIDVNPADRMQAGPTGQYQDAREPGSETRENLRSGALPRRSHSQELTEPIGLSGLVPSKETSKTLKDLEESIKKHDYKVVTQTLFHAVKRGSKRAVKAILGIMKKYKLNVCEDSFRERKYGKSVLHTALLFNEEDISRLLITKYPDLISLKNESEGFKNQTAFHIAASKGQCEMLDLMLQHCAPKESLELLNTRADGTYFKEEHPAGTLALTAAVWGGHCEMLGMLIENGADLDSTLDNGNTVLHYIVEQSVTYPKSGLPKKLFDEVCNKCAIWWKQKNLTPNARWKTRKEDVNQEMSKNTKMILRVDALRNLSAKMNDVNQNILSLAVSLRSNLTRHILNMEHVYKQQEAKFGVLSLSIFDVTEVTSYPPGKRICRYNPGSILHILGHRSPLAIRQEDLDKDILEEEPIRSLILMKWETYRFVYIIWCFVHLFLMVSLSVVSLYFHLPQKNTTAELVSDKITTGNATYGAVKELSGLTQERHGVRLWYLLFSVFPPIYLILEIVDIYSTGYKQGNIHSSWKSYLRMKKNEWSATGNGPSRVILALFSVNVQIWICLHMNRSDHQDIPLSFAMVLGWLFMVFFTRACRLTCRFSVMIQKMFFHDCIYFLVIYVFFLLGFCTAMHVLLVDGARSDLQAWNTLYGMLNLMTDAGEKETGEYARIPAVGMVLLGIFAVVSVILMLNMLIAMMNTSYEAVKDSKKNICRHQRLSIMLMFERRLWWWKWLCDRSQDGVMKANRGEEETRLLLLVTEPPSNKDRQWNSV